MTKKKRKTEWHYNSANNMFYEFDPASGQYVTTSVRPKNFSNGVISYIDHTPTDVETYTIGIPRVSGLEEDVTDREVLLDAYDNRKHKGKIVDRLAWRNARKYLMAEGFTRKLLKDEALRDFLINKKKYRSNIEGDKDLAEAVLNYYFPTRDRFTGLSWNPQKYLDTYQKANWVDKCPGCENSIKVINGHLDAIRYIGGFDADRANIAQYKGLLTEKNTESSQVRYIIPYTGKGEYTNIQSQRAAGSSGNKVYLNGQEGQWKDLGLVVPASSATSNDPKSKSIVVETGYYDPDGNPIKNSDIKEFVIPKGADVHDETDELNFSPYLFNGLNLPSLKLQLLDQQSNPTSLIKPITLTPLNITSPYLLLGGYNPSLRITPTTGTTLPILSDKYGGRLNYFQYFN